MFPDRVQYDESEYDIQNNDLLYKVDQKCQNTFEMLEILKNVNKTEHRLFILYFV